MLSLTFNPTSNRMWYIYAENYNGICVGFDSEILKEMNMGTGCIVKYYKKLPDIYPEPKQSLIEQYFTQVFSKLEKYNYEEEFRIFSFSPKNLDKNNRIIQMPIESYKEIILGKKMNKKYKMDFYNSIPDELKHIKIIEK